jgi:hypothetical protein
MTECRPFGSEDVRLFLKPTFRKKYILYHHGEDDILYIHCLENLKCAMIGFHVTLYTHHVRLTNYKALSV